MGTLHLFGDSFTEGHNLDTHYPNYKLWKEWRGGQLPKTWAELLSEKMEMEMNMKAIGGMSNHEIFQSICKEAHKFKRDDIVIINWAYMDRFKWATNYVDNYGRQGYHIDGTPIYYWKRLSSHKEDGKILSESTRNEIALNRTHPLHVQEMYDYENIINALCKSIGCDVYYWSSDNFVIIPLPKEKLFQKKYILHDLLHPEPYLDRIGISCFFESLKKYGFKYIDEETSGGVLDLHPGEVGHQTIYRLFYEYIMKWKDVD